MNTKKDNLNLIYSINEYKKGQFEPTGVGKLIEKQFCFVLKRVNELRYFADFEPSSHFVKILLVVCQNCLNQLDVNKQSLKRAHCSI
jgi:hypothetical protein